MSGTFDVSLVLLALATAGTDLASAQQPGSVLSEGRFENWRPFDKGFLDLVKWQFTRERRSWPSWIDAPPRTIPPGRNERGHLSWTFINHSTVLLRIDGLTVLTDPIWSERASPISFAGPKRVRPPGVRFEDLPPIDLVLLSHDHYDHLDLPTLTSLRRTHAPVVFTGLGVGARLGTFEASKVRELDWWQCSTVKGLEVCFVPARHFSGRGLTDRMKTLWGGFILRSAAGTVYFAGDTGFDRHFELIAHTFGPIRLAFLPIGAYEPRWFMAAAHIDPKEAVQAHLLLGAARSVGIHFGTFQLTDEGVEEPGLHLARARERAGVPAEAFIVPEFGETREVPTLHIDPASAMGSGE